MVTAAQTTAQTVISGASDAVAVAEYYDQAAHAQATEFLGRPGAFVYETTRTGVLAALLGLIIHRRQPYLWNMLL